MIKTTGTKLFISSDPLPENPTADDFKSLQWVEIGTVSSFPEVVSNFGSYQSAGYRVVKRTGTYTHAVGKIKKPKRARFCRTIYFNQFKSFFMRIDGLL